MRAPKFILLISLFAALSSFHVVTRAQEQIIEVFDDPYVSALFTILDRWEAGELVLKKSEFEPTFFQRLDEAINMQEEGDPVEQSISFDQMNSRWVKLPEQVEAPAPLTVGARLLLAATIYDKRDELKAQSSPSVDEFQEFLKMPLYMILVTSQTLMTQDVIDATALQRGGTWFFSLSYPFCCG